MKEKIIAKRYAEGFLSYVKDTIGRDKAVEELKSLKIAILSNPDFENFLYSPEITTAEKYAMISKALGPYFSQETIIFLRLLLDKERIESIMDICDYVRLTYSHGETVEAVLKTSYPMDLELIQKIKNALEEKLHKKFNLFLDLDASLLGGVEVRIGNKVIDGSVRRRLQELREKLMAVQV